MIQGMKLKNMRARNIVIRMGISQENHCGGAAILANSQNGNIITLSTFALIQAIAEYTKAICTLIMLYRQYINLTWKNDYTGER
jgi:hypothetical protein